ncbi:hypothetical protein WDW89_07855 [Deltaproteobacteria bacterium TL4]
MSKLRVQIVKANKVREPFMRGILTHSLVQRGVPFKKAYKIAAEVKSRIAKREEIFTTELKFIIDDEVKKRCGEKALEEFQTSTTVGHLPTIQVISENSSPAPFSKGLLAKSITASGIIPSRAHQMAQEVETELIAEGITKITRVKLHERTYAKIVAEEGKETGQSYEISRSILRLDRPVIIYLGGAGGTGKSSLATELASRLGILKVTGTDMIRQVMRTILSKEILPSLHSSSFEVGNLESYSSINREKERVLMGFSYQSSKVCIGVKAVVERAIIENMSVIIEGVHLIPSMIQFPQLKDFAYHIPIMLALKDEKSHKGRFIPRGLHAKMRQPDRYRDEFENIRLIHDYIIAQSHQYDIDVVENTDFDNSIHELVHIVISSLQHQVSETKDPTEVKKEMTKEVVKEVVKEVDEKQKDLKKDSKSKK